MDFIRWIYMLIIFVMAFTSCSEDMTIEETGATYDYTDMESEIIDDVNDRREFIGADSCNIDNYLSRIALEHVNYMIDEGKPSHNNFDKRSSVIISYFNTVIVGENVSYGYRTATEIVEGWINSPTHNTILSSKRFTLMGIAARKDSKGVLYVTNIFIGK